MGLRSRLIISVVGLATFILVAWSSLLAYNGIREHRGHAEAGAIEVLSLLAVPASTDLAQRRVEALDALLGEAAERDSSILWIGIVDSEGRVLAHSDPSRYGRIEGDEFTMTAIGSADATVERTLFDDVPVLLTSMPVATSSEVGAIRWGTLTAAISMVDTEATISEFRVNLAVASLLMLGVMGAAWATAL